MSEYSGQNKNIIQGPINPKYEKAYETLEAENPGLPALVERVKFIRDKNTHSSTRVEDLPGYLGSGSDKDVFELNGMAIKVLRPPVIEGQEMPFDYQIRPLIQGQGIPHLEQLVAVHNEEVIVTSLHKGKNVTDLPSRELRYITAGQLIELENTLQQMKEHGLHPHNLGGILWNKDNGFSVVDHEFLAGDNHPQGELRNFHGKAFPEMEEMIRFMFADHKGYEWYAKAKYEDREPGLGRFVPDAKRQRLTQKLVEKFQKAKAGESVQEELRPADDTTRLASKGLLARFRRNKHKDAA